MENVYFAIPEIYGDSLSYYEVLRELIKAMNVIIDNYDTIPEQIADAVKNLDAAQLFSAVLNQLIDTIATDNTKSNNAVKVYKKHDLLYATFNETVNLYESIIDFTTGTELIIGTNIREVNISELFIELRELIGNEAQEREQVDTTLQNAINTEKSAREQADTTLQQNINTESSAREQADTDLQQKINAETSARSKADTNLQTKIDNEIQERNQADNTKANKSDVLTLEEIQESSNLTGKIAGASGLKSVIDILNSSIQVPNAVEAGKDAIINNVKYVCSLIDSGVLRFSRITNQGNGFVMGLSYEKSLNPPYAIFLYATIYSNTLYVVRSSNYVWSVTALTGSEL